MLCSHPYKYSRHQSAAWLPRLHSANPRGGLPFGARWVFWCRLVSAHSLDLREDCRRSAASLQLNEGHTHTLCQLTDGVCEEHISLGHLIVGVMGT